MGCCLLSIGLFISARLLIIVLYFQSYIDKAYVSTLYPLLGFFFMPWSTIAYTYCINECGGVKDIAVLWLILAVMADMGTSGSAVNENKKHGEKL